MAAEPRRTADSGPAEDGDRGGTGGGLGRDTERDRATFECNICLDTARDAVISLCGHLFCWPCLHQWLETRPSRQQCPVCKAGISRENVIPLYGRGSSSQDDPRLKTPPRPQGQRPEPESRGPFQGFGDTGFHMSFGIDTPHPGGGHPDNGNPGNGNSWQDSLFLFVAIFFFFWLLSI